MSESAEQSAQDNLIDALLASDLAAEVRNEFEGQRFAGSNVPAATGHVFARFRDALSNANDGPVVLLAVAALQVRENGLMPVVKEAVLDLIDSGEALNAYRTEDWQVRKQRKMMLEDFAAMLREMRVS